MKTEIGLKDIPHMDKELMGVNSLTLLQLTKTTQKDKLLDNFQNSTKQERNSKRKKNK